MKLRMTLMLGGVLLGFSGLVLMDCGSSGGGGNPEGGMGTKGSGGTTGTGGTMGTGSGGTTGTGSGGTTGTGSGGTTGTGSGGTMGSGEGGGDGGAVDCGKAATLHQETADGGLYCPFSYVDGGAAIYCSTPGQVCCAPACSTTPCTTPPSVCVAAGPTGGKTGTGCPVSGATNYSYVYECEGPAGCAGNSKGSVCCAAGTVNLVGPSCSVGESYVSGNTVGTVCESACAAGENIVCDTATGECPSGMTCTPTKLHGDGIGFCQ